MQKLLVIGIIAMSSLASIYGIWFVCSHNRLMAASTPRNLSHRLNVTGVSLVPLTVCEALKKATIFFDAPSDDIGPANSLQELFIDKQYIPYNKERMSDHFNSEELMSYISRDYKELNVILKKKGFSLQFPPFKSIDIGILAIQDVLVTWLHKGKVVTIESGDKQFDGVEIKQANFFAGHNPSLIIVELMTQSNDKVYLATKTDGQLFATVPTDEMVADAINKYSAALQEGQLSIKENFFDAVQFPMILYQVQPDSTWLEHMRIGLGHVAAAIQEVIFKMNEIGARSKVATGMIMTTAVFNPKPPVILIINTPFLLWIERPGVALPIFAGYMKQEFWKNPGALDSN